MTTQNILDTICVYAWDYPVLSLSRNELRYCCRAAPQTLSKLDLQQGTKLFNEFAPVSDTRRALLTGVKTPNCAACWNIESSGGKSPRTKFTKFIELIYESNMWPELTRDQIKQKLLSLTDDEIETLVNLQHVRKIEISLGNTCDLKCVYCSHHYSSQWAAERLKYKEILPVDIERELPKITDSIYEDIWWSWFDSSAGKTAKWVNFIGGEPLIMDKFYTYCIRVIDFYEKNPPEDQTVVVSLVTNFNTPLKFYEKFTNICQRIVAAQKIELHFNLSCESIGNRTEFIRFGTKWETVLVNIDKFCEFINQYDPERRIIFNLMITINALCVSDLANFFRWVIALQQRHPNISINLLENQVVWPEWTSPYILPTSYGKYIDDATDVLMEKMTDDLHPALYENYGHYIRFLKTIKAGIENPSKNSMARKMFAEQIDKMTLRRNVDFHATFPEMIPFYNDCKNLN